MAVVKQSAKATQTAVDNEEWVRATNLWSMTELAVSSDGCAFDDSAKNHFINVEYRTDAILL